MEKEVDFDLAYLIVPILSFAAMVIVYLKAARDYSVVDMDSPGFILAVLSAFPYFLTFAFSFFCKNETQRKSFYGVLGILAFMTAIEWIAPKSTQLKNIFAVMWFFQTVFVVPFLIYTIKQEDRGTT